MELKLEQDGLLKEMEYIETKRVARGLYTDMVNYIELFRRGEAKAADFVSLYTTLMQSRLDLPAGVFADLRGFAGDFLQHLGGYLAYVACLNRDKMWMDTFDTAQDYFESYADAYYHPPAADWKDALYLPTDPLSRDHQAFEAAVKAQYEENMESDYWAFPYERIAGAAYARLEEILKGYLVD